MFESDDWGAVRTPSREVFERLRDSRNGIRVNRFDELDCLESREDLEALGEVLGATGSGSEAGAARFTCNMVLGNPDFNAIKAAAFERYINESLFSSYQRVYGQKLEPLWQQLQSQELVQPQFHAREHLNVALWMKDLRAGNPATLEAFRMGCYGHMQKTGSPHHGHYLAAYHPDSPDDLVRKSHILGVGLKLFEDVFGFRSITMIPCNYTWADGLTDRLAAEGVTALQGARIAHMADVGKAGKLLVNRRYWTAEPSDKLANIVRNVTFEPYAIPDEDPVPRALCEISRAFLWGKPAVVSTHRINYVSGLDIRHRDRSLRSLRQLIDAIKKRWPDAEFLTSDELAKVMVPGSRPSAFTDQRQRLK